MAGDRCVWHTDAADKPRSKLKNTIENGDLHGAIVPSETDLTGLSFPDETGLIDADLSEANLRSSDLSGAILTGANLSEARLSDTDLSEADLIQASLSETSLAGANLSGINLAHADLVEANLKNANLSGANLTDADLSEADLRDSNLLKINLRDADLSEANLSMVNLSQAKLFQATLAETELFFADLTGANLKNADLSGANLREAILSKADLRNADLSGAVLAETGLSSVTLSRATDIDPPGKQIRRGLADIDSISEERVYDSIARANHELREAYSSNGLIGGARNARFRERKARRQEAFAEGRRGRLAWAGSVLSQVFTGYGVRLRWVVGSMLLLYLVSAGVYWNWGDMWWGRSLYYSMVTFTTSPPEPPSGTIPSVVAGFETFAGTAAIIFLGYVLGTRERV